MAEEHKETTSQCGLRSAYGHSRNGDPLSINRAPAEDLSPWIARIFATDIFAEDSNLVHCGIYSDTPVLRVLFQGEWTVETIYGTGRYRNTAILTGPQTRRMPVSLRGPFAALGIALKPGAVSALGGPSVNQMLDRVIHFEDIFGGYDWGKSETLIDWLDPVGPPERWLAVTEKLIRQLIQLKERELPDPIVAAFDKAAFANPNLSIANFAKEHSIGQRSFERLIKRTFGQTPKQVLQRARVLDIAANLRGVADDEEAEEIALRYYDQSHMIREFTRFIHMTPRQFARTPQPLMTLTLEARQARRLEVLGRNHPGMLPPWRR